MLDWIWQRIQEEGSVIQQAPITFFSLLVIISSIGWAWNRKHYKGLYGEAIKAKGDTIDSLNEKIKELENPKKLTPPEESLKNRVSILAAEIFGFLIERKNRKDGLSPRHNAGRFDLETITLFTQKFSKRVIKAYSKLKKLKITDRELDMYHDNYPGVIELGVIADNLRALSKKLP